MQRDTDLAFRDIHETLDAMLVNIKDINSHVIESSGITGKALDLRFLTYSDAASDLVLHLAERGAHIGETNYVAVSYTWQKFDPVTNAEAVSRYMISTSDGSIRKARSQDAVLHRAVQFAKANDAPFIWIDNDCIDQADPVDVEQHLHIVHEIFYQSRHAIGLLSFHIVHESQVDSIRYIHEGTCLEELSRLPEDGLPKALDIARKMMRGLRLFATISADKWFSRTWTFMERLSAPHMRLLLPCEPLLSVDNTNPVAHAELELSLMRLQQLLKRLKNAHYNPSHGDASFVRQDTHQLIGEIISRLEFLLSSRFLVEFKTPPWRQALTLRHVTNIFKHIEQCDNTVLSDRLLILGYLCGFSRRLETTKMNHYQYGYSTSAIVLLLMNGWLQPLYEKGGGTFLWNHTLGEVLADWSCRGRNSRGGSTTSAQDSMEVVLRGQEHVTDDFSARVRLMFTFTGEIEK
ncbi:hypothetical protein DL768_009521 [Monosporascus sp. mg162]|nr:hypothetical protein DL768_009521 [Monosporascus sp. mg162]